eukprot:gnl/MRDRNA2_/MRDRNA2_192553_c0_seq1.p1 gnl/MRDRNA2_/MRDRNA2_192553_c0~~gnl/MRDRNA2_/MRDRNA2_192553_c0_seq1.p1  ORF type:complete len:321 (+),score=31.30 gnl/MRDRNA2_/MRDRNA2_192553_c0_seq1:2-964(+)
MACCAECLKHGCCKVCLVCLRDCGLSCFACLKCMFWSFMVMLTLGLWSYARLSFAPYWSMTWVCFYMLFLVLWNQMLVTIVTMIYLILIGGAHAPQLLENIYGQPVAPQAPAESGYNQVPAVPVAQPPGQVTMSTTAAVNEPATGELRNACLEGLSSYSPLLAPSFPIKDSSVSELIACNAVDLSKDFKLDNEERYMTLQQEKHQRWGDIEHSSALNQLLANFRPSELHVKQVKIGFLNISLKHACYVMELQMVFLMLSRWYLYSVNGIDESLLIQAYTLTLSERHYYTYFGSVLESLRIALHSGLWNATSLLNMFWRCL